MRRRLILGTSCIFLPLIIRFLQLKTEQNDYRSYEVDPKR